MWQLTQHVQPKTKQDSRLKVLLQDMATYSYATYSTEMENDFKSRIQEIPRTNNFSPELMYGITPRNHKSVEVWKLDAKGDFTFKMFTLDFVSKNED